VNWWQSFKTWLHAPFTTPLDPVQVGEVTVIVLVVAMAWGITLRHFIRGVEAAA